MDLWEEQFFLGYLRYEFPYEKQQENTDLCSKLGQEIRKRRLGSGRRSGGVNVA